MMPKGIILLLKQLLPDFDAEKLAAHLTQAQQQLPAFIAALQAKIESIDARLERIEKSVGVPIWDISGTKLAERFEEHNGTDATS